MNPNLTRGAALGAVLAAALALPARAQSPTDPLLTITMRGGWITGPSLWRIAAQPAPASPDSTDIVGLGRLFRTGFVAGVGATLFRSPHVGYTVAVDFLGIATESRCSGPAHWAYNPDHVNQQACQNIQGASVRTSAVAFQGGATWRPIASGRMQPYLQALGGLAYLGGSFVETKASVFVATTDTVSPFRIRTFLGDPEHRSITWIGTLAAGFTLEMTPASQLRFEARDHITSVPVATGPGDALTIGVLAPVGSKVVHLLSFTIGLDIVLEQSRRPHRY